MNALKVLVAMTLVIALPAAGYLAWSIWRLMPSLWMKWGALLTLVSWFILVLLRFLSLAIGQKIPGMMYLVLLELHAIGFVIMAMSWAGFINGHKK